jgi:hypothetical protein
MPSNFDHGDVREKDMQLSLRIPSHVMSALMTAAGKGFSSVSVVARQALATEMRRQGYLNDDGK